jgi:hypothetical protein
LIAAVGFDERRIVKALGFEFRKSGISFLFHVKNKVDGRAVGRQGLAQARQDDFL